MPYRYLGTQRRPLASVRLNIQHKMNGSPQKVGAVGLGDEGIHRLERSVRQIQVVGQHDDRDSAA